MKIKKYTYMMLAVLLFSGTACSDFLDKEYDATLSDEKVFTNQTMTREFLTDIYTNLPDGLAPLNDDQFTGASRDCMTDNATSYWGLHYYTKVATDSYTAKDHPLLGQWNTDFAGIRKCNIFLNNAQASVVGNAEKSGDDNKLYERYCNEARLLRALFHFDLVCWFGDMLIVGENEDGTNIVFSMENPEQMNQARTPAADVLQWVADECDKVKDALPFRYSNETTNWGRVNGATAYALKARALLYKASALNNPTGEQSWWQAAAQAAQDFIDKNAQQSNPYQLYTTGNPENDYYECFTTNPVYNNEIILSRSVWNTNKVEQVFLPVGFTGKFSAAGRTSPTQNFVDCFEMLDGKRIDEGGGDYAYDAQNPYVNRDPRLAQIVFYQGMTWGSAKDNEQRKLDMRTDGGKDYSASMGGTCTGYYLKKFVNNISCQNPTNYPHSWIIFRYGEVLLNAAEAYCEAGNLDKAKQYINEVRDRAGMPHYEYTDQAELLKRIRNERRIELSFEDHRMWDLRRWRAYDNVTASEEQSKPYYEQLLNLYGVEISGTEAAPVYQYGPARSAQNGGVIETRVFNIPKNYLFPIPDSDVKMAPNLKQNPGWEISGE